MAELEDDPFLKVFGIDIRDLSSIGRVFLVDVPDLADIQLMGKQFQRSHRIDRIVRCLEFVQTPPVNALGMSAWHARIHHAGRSLVDHCHAKFGHGHKIIRGYGFIIVPAQSFQLFDKLKARVFKFGDAQKVRTVRVLAHVLIETVTRF